VPRALAVVLLALQAFLWGGGSIAEARSAAEALSRYSHVEDQGNTACPPIHSHLDCLICRTLHGGAAGGASSTLFTRAASGADRPVLEAVVAVQRGLAGTLGSRGPPTG
jgi:hypothetical protein